jgi:hypothetical protein
LGITVRRFFLAVWLVVVACACGTHERLVYSADFSFASYQFIVVSKPSDANSHSSAFLYSLDMQLGNVLSQYGMRVVGDKEIQDFTAEQKAKTLVLRGALDTYEDKRAALSVSFDDYVTGRTMANMTSASDGNIFNHDDRDKMFRKITEGLQKSLTEEKGLIEVQPK